MEYVTALHTSLWWIHRGRITGQKKILSEGVEPTTLGLLDPRSNQLSYACWAAVQAFLKQCSSVNASCRAVREQKKVLLNRDRRKPVDGAVCAADGASYLAGCAKDFKTIAEASRITAEWMPRATASMRSRRPRRDWPLPNLVQRSRYTSQAKRSRAASSRASITTPT